MVEAVVAQLYKEFPAASMSVSVPGRACHRSTAGVTPPNGRSGKCRDQFGRHGRRRSPLGGFPL